MVLSCADERAKDLASSRGLSCKPWFADAASHLRPVGGFDYDCVSFALTKRQHGLHYVEREGRCIAGLKGDLTPAVIDLLDLGRARSGRRQEAHFCDGNFWNLPRPRTLLDVTLDGGTLMYPRAKLFVLAASAVSLIGMSSLNASARIVCNGDGYCWHAPEAYVYPPSVHLDIHPDGWSGKKASIALGKSTRVAATGTVVSGRFSERAAAGNFSSPAALTYAHKNDDAPLAQLVGSICLG